MTGDALADEFRAIATGVSVPQLRRNCAAYWERRGGAAEDVATALIGLWGSSRDPARNGVRMGIAMTLGPAAVVVDKAMDFMTGTIPDDQDWRVQEALAKGFDWYCAERGWEEALPAIEGWLGHPHANVRRAAVEGPRAWTRRPFFAEHPQLALQLLGGLRADPSRFVRKSVANALSDISKGNPDLVLAELRSWAGDPAAEWVANRACRHLVTSHAEEVERVVAAVRG